MSADKTIDDLRRDYIDPEFNDEGEPFDYFLDTVIDKAQFTPDMRKIMSDRHHLLFTYGTLKSGHKRHGLLDCAEFIGNGVTTVQSFQLWNFEFGGYPIAIMGPNGTTEAPKAAIYGEVYLVPNYLIPVLDSIENNMKMFHRVRTFVTMTSNRYKATRPILGTWIYNGIRRFWEDSLIEDCTPCPLIKPKTKDLPNFYNYKEAS